MIAKRVIFSGHVQGVGFRYSTVNIARNFQVAGWVKNLDDGRVELQVKGAREHVDAFLRELTQESHLAGNISSLESFDANPNQIRQESGFEISR